MKNYSDNEIKEFVKNLFLNEDSYIKREVNITISHRKTSSWRTAPSDCVDIEVTNMYEAPKLSFKEFKKLSEFFETDNIDKYDDISNKGCDTCDYGSSYGFVLRIW